MWALWNPGCNFNSGWDAIINTLIMLINKLIKYCFNSKGTCYMVSGINIYAGKIKFLIGFAFTLEKKKTIKWESWLLKYSPNTRVVGMPLKPKSSSIILLARNPLLFIIRDYLCRNGKPLIRKSRAHAKKGHNSGDSLPAVLSSRRSRSASPNEIKTRAARPGSSLGRRQTRCE